MTVHSPDWLADLAARMTRWAYEPFPPPDANGRDPFRWCDYCGCDCDASDPEHAVDCPSNTGLFPVTARDLGMRGPRDPYAYGMLCMDCGVKFEIGDMYAHRPISDDVDEIVCVGCRVLNPEAPTAGCEL